ncbi:MULTISPECIES: ADP-ribose diphosphatase [Shewanella]|jgi:ADP-ribose pyrophosphatase|uniref:ADP-ribose pyrophosphatase n=1 Tax=Shewanella psychromarinicola TaxID=2487742 RepID=A0A3N4E924_9GAMM|nr:ADP-ribose diphosphatase [Shewanella psychromarinicola]AZG34903.1 ADP-ribose diphosphatase [Shewanella psychromarinicola]MCL1080678.1 ADP-ribose diphosphatase [Shewanella psychromarinicola]RPA33302.1 ADP-ribose diphosphatase [Shewanella psychromarinicola]
MSEQAAITTFDAESGFSLISKKVLYKGFFQLDEYTFKHKLFKGGWSGEVRREVFERGHAVVVIPYDPIRDEIVLIEQIRVPALATTKSIWLLELVAGIIEPGELPEKVAERELAEEAGLSLLGLTFINSYLVSPGGTTERFHLFLGQVDATKAAGIHGLEHENEDIRVHVVSREQAYKWVNNGRIDNAATVLGIQWLMLNYQQIRDSL